jgi:fucose 4-O-acetylase-like acetyltransferase
MSRHYTALSGIAIVLIVINHAVQFGLGVTEVGGVGAGILFVVQALGVFAVPTFLFISGAFLAYAVRELSLVFVKNSLTRILFPYVAWSAVFYLVVFLTADVSYSILGYVKNLLVGYPYHFVPLLLFWYVSAPLIVRMCRRHGVLVLAVVGAYQMMLLIVRWPDVFAVSESVRSWMQLLRPPVLFTSMSDWGVYFPLGLVLGMHAASVAPRLMRLRWLGVSAASVLFALGLANAFEMIACPWARFVAPIPLMFVLPSIRRTSIPVAQAFEYVGRRSYGAYLVHLPVLGLTVFLFGQLNLGLENRPLVVFPTLLMIGLGVPLLLMGAMARVGRLRGMFRYLFGVAPPVMRAGRCFQGEERVARMVAEP